MNKLLITGGLGFIGHNLISQLIDLPNCDVVSVDNKTNYGILNQTELDYVLKLRTNKIKHIKNYNTDIRNNQGLDKIFANELPNTVVHLASLPRQKVVNTFPQLGSEVMIGGLINLLELSVKYNVKKFVYISSSMVYGNFNQTILENNSCQPIGQYAIFKLTGEQLVKYYSSKYNFDYVIVRPSAVYGPIDVEDRVISKFFYAAKRGQDLFVNGQDEKCDFTFIEDTTDGIIRAILNPLAVNNTFNISKSTAIPIIEAAEKIVKLVGRGKIKVRNKDPQHPSRVNLDISKASKILNFSPKFDLDNGLGIYYQWIESHFDNIFVNEI